MCPAPSATTRKPWLPLPRAQSSGRTGGGALKIVIRHEIGRFPHTTPKYSTVRFFLIIFFSFALPPPVSFYQINLHAYGFGKIRRASKWFNLIVFFFNYNSVIADERNLIFLLPRLLLGFRRSIL